MSLLLDTHALLWYVLEDTKLSRSAREHIDEEEGEVFVSPASLWEIAIKISLGDYKLDEPFEPFWQEMFPKCGLTMLPIAISHTARIIELPHFHRDPFDRLIIAQALSENLPVVSCDPKFDGYNVLRIW
jgi:PIN domain nuclease of toxin-antitoxin system